MQTILDESSAVGALFDTIRNGVSQKRKDNKSNGRVYLKGSISKYTNNLVMSFPMLCDNTLPIDTLTMISTSNEHNITSMLQLLFSSISLKADNGIDIIKSYYKGLENKTMEEMIDWLDRLVFESGETIYKDPEIRQALIEMTAQLKNQKQLPVESFSEKAISNYKVYETPYKTVVRELNYYALRLQKDKFEDQKQNQKQNLQLQKDKFEDQKQNKLNDTRNQSIQNNNRINQNAVISNQDAKKQNLLPPTLMVINFVDPAENGAVIDKSFVAGVKSRLIPVDSMDIVERLAEKDKSKGSGFQKFVKWTTGEVTLTKAIADSFEKTKLKAINNAKKDGASRMWDVLQARSIKNTASKIKRTSNDASSITGLVISQETVNYLKNTYDFDIERIKNARDIMEAYNLLSIYIADEANEVVKYMYDGNSQYEYLSYTSMHKDVSDKNYKKIINLLNNQGR